MAVVLTQRTVQKAKGQGLDDRLPVHFSAMCQFEKYHFPVSFENTFL